MKKKYTLISILLAIGALIYSYTYNPDTQNGFRVLTIFGAIGITLYTAVFLIAIKGSVRLLKNKETPHRISRIVLHFLTLLILLTPTYTFIDAYFHLNKNQLNIVIPPPPIVSPSEERVQYFPCEILEISTRENPITIPFTCSAQITNGEEAVDIRFQIKDGKDMFEIIRDDQVFFSIEASEKFFNFFGRYYRDTSDPLWLAPDIMYLIDVTYDGYNDLWLRSSFNGYNFGYTLYRYNPSTRTFDEKPLIVVDLPFFDSTKKTLESYSNITVDGRIFVVKTYTFSSKGEYVLTEREYYEEGENGYLYIKKELVDGVLVTTDSKSITRQEYESGRIQ